MAGHREKVNPSRVKWGMLSGKFTRRAGEEQDGRQRTMRFISERTSSMEKAETALRGGGAKGS